MRRSAGGAKPTVLSPMQAALANGRPFDGRRGDGKTRNACVARRGGRRPRASGARSCTALGCDDNPFLPTHTLPIGQRLRWLLFGPPRDVRDPHVFHRMSLVAFLAWIGLGADGLSSSAYGPDESWKALVEAG